MQRTAISLLALILAGCGRITGLTGLQTGLGQDPHHIGPVRVSIRSEDQVRSFCDSRHTVEIQVERFLGCYFPQENIMVAVHDTRVILLLFKIYLEGGKGLSRFITERDFSFLGKDPYKIGPFEVWVRGEYEVHLLCHALSSGSLERKVGCWITGKKNTILGAQEVILIIDNPFVLLHELKHHFEGAWHK